MPERKAVLRFDVSTDIGFGHFARARALAGVLKDYRFAVRPAAIPILRAAGIDQDLIIEVQDPMDLGWLDQSHAFGHIITDICYDKHQAMAQAEILALSATRFHITVIDSMPPDHFAAPHQPQKPAPDLVVTPYLGAQGLRPEPFAKKWIGGGEYSLLDCSYRDEISAGLRFPDDPRILICGGGVDPSQISFQALQALQAFPGGIDVVVGPLFDAQHRQRLSGLADQMPKVRLHDNPQGLAPLINRSSVVIGRPGLIRYEAAVLQRHGIFLSETESYYEYYQGFQAAGLAKVFFTIHPQGHAQFIRRLEKLAAHSHSDPLLQPNKRAWEHVAPDGTDRLMAHIFR